MFEALVYFDGPLSRWGRKPERAREVIWSCRSRFLAVATGRAKARARGLAHCLWCVLDARGEMVAGHAPSVGTDFSS